jgi:hypothetical protein
MVANTVGEHTASIFRLEKALHYYYPDGAVAFAKTMATIDQNTQVHIPEDQSSFECHSTSSSSYYSEFQLGEWLR